MKAIMCAAFLALSFGAVDSVFACRQEYFLVGPNESESAIDASTTTQIALGETYTLRIEYYEDHRNCTAIPEETMFLLDGARWRVNRETQPLVLTATPEWNRPSSRTNVGEVTFHAAAAGTWRVEIVRTCTRDGYTGWLEFEVS